MSEVLNTQPFDEDSILNARKVVKKVIIDDSDDEQIEEVDVLSDEEYEGERKKSKKRELKREDMRPRRRMTAISVRSVVGSGVQRNFHITCLVCQRKISCSDEKSPIAAYHICDKCMDDEKEQTQEPEMVILKSKDKLKSIPASCTDMNPREFAYCKCQNCVRRQRVEEERMREAEMLRSCWDDLKKNIRQMFRDGLDVNMCSSKGKKFDIEKIKRNVAILTEKDPHQLYKRLESIGYEYVMNLKSDDLWQILVAPQVVPALIELFESGADEEKMELERAKLFIKTLLDRFSCQQETVRNMSSLLSALDTEYLTKFGISWKVVNHHIFDCVIYQDDLLINYLPSMEKVLKCSLIIADEAENEKIARAEADRTDIPLGAFELAQSFRVLHKLMVTSREIFKKANANIAFIHHITRKAKGEYLEEDMEFFKMQRKMMRNYASRKKQYYRWHSELPCGDVDGFFDDDDDKTDSEADAIDFSKRLHELIEEGPPASICVDHNGKVSPCVQCKECSVRHCSCDECRIAHVITCGVRLQGDELFWSKSSTDSSENDEDKDSDNGTPRKRKQSSEHFERLTQKNFHHHTARALFTLHDHRNKKEIAWGEWQVPYSFSDSIEFNDCCLFDKKSLLDSSPDGDRQESLDGIAKFENGDFTGSDVFVAEVRDVAEKIKCDVQETLIEKARSQRPKTSVGRTKESSPAKDDKEHGGCCLNMSETERNKRNEKCEQALNSVATAKAESRTETKPTVALSATKKKKTKRTKKQKSKKNTSKESSAECTDTDSESSSPSLAGAAEWSQVKLVNDAVINDNKSLENFCEYQALSDGDRLLWKKLSNGHFAPKAKDESSVSGKTLELFGKKTMEKPQFSPKSVPAPPVTRIIRKLKGNADRSDIIVNSSTGSISKSLSASTKERLPSEMKDADRKTKERPVIHPPECCEGEKCARSGDVRGGEIKMDKLVFRYILLHEFRLGRSAAEATRNINSALGPDSAAEEAVESWFKKFAAGDVDLENEPDHGCWSSQDSGKLEAVVEVNSGKTAQMRVTEGVKDCLPKEASKGSEAASQEAVAAPFSNESSLSSHNGSSKASSSSKSNRKTVSKGGPTNDVPVSSKALPARAEKEENLVEMRKNQTLAAAIAKQLGDIGKVISGYYPPTSKAGGTNQKSNAKNSLSTTVDFNVDFNELDFNSLPAEMAKKLRDEGKLDKLIAQAIGVKKSRMALSGKLEYKCDDLKHTSYCDPHEELLAYHSDNDIDDISDEDEEDSDEDWSDCDAADHRHPHRHHSCDNKKKVERTASGSRRGHCDCCYCEMFGHSAAEATKAGRTPKIRERLRKKLKERNGREEKSESETKKRPICQEKHVCSKPGEKSSETSSAAPDPNLKPPVVPDAPIEEILDYINEKDNVAAQVAASKAAKRARQKLRKQEEKVRLEMQRRKQEELRKAEEAKALQRKKEQQAAQQAAKREKALKAEEKRRKAAEDRARALKRQKELREMERQQHAKEQERAQKENVQRTAATKKAEEKQKTAKTVEAVGSVNKRTDSNSAPSCEAAGGKSLKEAEKSHSVSCSPAAVIPDIRPPSAPSSVALQQSQFACYTLPSPLANEVTQSLSQYPASLLVVPSSLALSHPPGIPSPEEIQLQGSDCQGLYIGLPCQPHLLPQPYSPPSRNETGSVSPKALGYSPNLAQLAATSSGYDSFNKYGPLYSPPGLESRPAKNSFMISPQVSCSHFTEHTGPLPEATRAPRVAVAPATLFSSLETSARLGQVSYPASSSCIEAPCSSNSSASSSLSCTSTQQSFFDRTAYMRPVATLTRGFENGNLLPGYGADLSSSLPPNGLFAPLRPSVNDTYSLSTSSLFGNVDHPSAVDSALNKRAASESLTTQREPTKSSGDALPGSSQLTAAVRAKRIEARKAFLSASPNPLANYEFETRMLEAVAAQDGIFPSRNPMIFEPGDPRLAAAIASMKFDPHETFKPRPDAELEFLDPLELEIEHFKRVMWEAENSTHSRVPLRELPRLEPENDANAVFHFAPLV